MNENSTRLPALNPRWKERLLGLLDDVLDFSEYPVRDGEGMRAESSDSRTILETFERNGSLDKLSFQIALPDGDELVLLKLSCWTLICLKSLFPEWKEVNQWVQIAADESCEAKG